MNLTLACSNILTQLNSLLTSIRDEDYTKPSEGLNSSTVGQHLRHTLEFFFCFENGYAKGVVNYDKRAHDKMIESDRYLAIAALDRIRQFVSDLSFERELDLEVNYALDKNEFITIRTNAVRELVYNIEHAVHHMAMMKIGVREVAPYIKLPVDFGVAASTIRHKEAAEAER